MASRVSSVSGLFAPQASGNVNLSVCKQLWQEKAILSLRISALFYASGCFSTSRYQLATPTVQICYDSRLPLSVTYKLSGGKTRSAHTSSSADEEGRAGH